MSMFRYTDINVYRVTIEWDFVWDKNKKYIWTSKLRVF